MSTASSSRPSWLGTRSWARLADAVENSPRLARAELLDGRSERRPGSCTTHGSRVGHEGTRRRIAQSRRAHRVEVALGRFEIGVAEHVANGHGIEDPGQERAGGVAEVVEAERWKVG